MTLLRRALLPALLLLASPAALAGKVKVRHSNVVAPTWAGEVVGVDIGVVTHMRTDGDLLVLGGQRGVAGVGADGTVRWTVTLPEVMVRNVEVDAAGVGWTGWTLAGVEDRWKAFNAWAGGQLVDKLEVGQAEAGAISRDGQALWSSDQVGLRPLSPPGLHTGTLAVMTGEDFVVLDRATGAPVGRGGLKSGYDAFPGLSGVLDHITRGEVVPVGDGYFTSFYSTLFHFDQAGALREKEVMAGLTPYVDITCGPVQTGELLVFGSTGDSNVASAFFAMKSNMKNKWKTWSPDKQSGCGDIVVDGDRIYAASNFWVFSLDDKGKVKWQAVNKKGGLYPSANRGIRYIGNHGMRKTYGDLMVVGQGRVYVATANGHDVLTVLDAEDGSYVQTIDVNETIVSLAVVGDRLAVATPQGLRLMDLGG
ncbi:hypothetical protein L6R53_27430 [Myxococcota bacterium]|nr:hypothetical protein [Myxococcota bacterium]